ncbi:MAG: PAS domain S-box protein [Rubrivivax sp.]|nr:PAS domain S-box protein [Rubrivivax sp.]
MLPPSTLAPPAGRGAAPVGWPSAHAAWWSAPVAAAVLDARERLVDANPAYCVLVGRSRAALVGRELLPGSGGPGPAPPPRVEPAGSGAYGDPGGRQRLVDARGAVRHVDVVVVPLEPGPGPARWLALLQDRTEEHAARDAARRAEDELAEWFDLAGSGMLHYDDSGLVLRSNPAFESLVGQVPVVLADAAPELQALLGWQDGGIAPGLRAGGPPLEALGDVPRPDGGRRRLGARVTARPGPDGRLRCMAVVQDRSAEHERDVARLEIGMLMDAASVGVATYDPARGWMRAPGPGGDAPARAGGLQGIGRDLVEPSSLPEYERLQQALRGGKRTTVRYAVRHPELGRRWLMTRVEPGPPSAGRHTTSVVTLDVTEQETAQHRNEQLLRELTTILDTSTAGVAYLRGRLVVRANRRFERMLGLEPGAAAGASIEELFGRDPERARVAGEALAALAAGSSFEAELPAPPAAAPERWHSLSVRLAEPADEHADAVAVLTDISRLKQQQADLERLLRDRELMFSLSEVGIAYLRGARIERANQALAQLTGYSVSELTSLDTAELHASARDCVEFEGRVAEALRQHGRFSGERRLRRRDGSLLWVQVAARPVDAGDAEGGLICSFVDVDERHRARESLALQAERTRAVLDSVLVGIVTVAGASIEWMNRSARRMFAGELADFVGEPISIVATSQADHPLRRTDYVQRLADGQSETFECRLQARDGRDFWVVGNVVATGGGQLTFALLDIERRRQAEVRIARAQASLQRVIETAPLAIVLLDASRREVVQANQASTALFEGSCGEMAGRTLGELAAPASVEALGDWIDEAVSAGQVLRREWLVGDAQAPELQRVWDLRAVALDPPGGGAAESPQVLLVASDVTEQRAAEQARLQAAIVQRELLVREVHHRIKNNLQGVAGLLQQNAARHPELAAALFEAVGQVQAIAQVYGLQVGAGGPLGVAEVAGAIAGSVQRTFGRPIAFEAPPDVEWMLPEAESIPVALTLNELLTNAVKHGRGAVRCRVLAAGDDVDAVRIAVENDGRLPPGFDLGAVRGGISGLGLVRALLPRRGARLAIDEAGGVVHARITLQPPCVHRPA